MVGIRNINPMVRAIGTMGAVAAVVGGITFAALTSNTVALSPNTLSSATANLQIGGTNTGTCSDASNGPVKGMNFVLTPGVPSNNFLFCLKNTSTVPLAITVGIPQGAFTGDTGISPSAVTLKLRCTNGGTATGTLDQYTGGTPLGNLAANATTDCQAQATLSSSSLVSGQTVPPFDIDFVGTQTTST